MLVLYYNVTYRFIQVSSVVAVLSSRVQWFRPGSNTEFTHPLSLVCFCMEALYFFLTFTALAILLIKGHLPAVPNLFLPSGISFVEDNFSVDQGRGEGFRMIQGMPLLCTLFLLYQLPLRSSGISSWRLGTPGLQYRMFLCL